MSSIRFCITHSGPDQWTVDEIEGGGWFRSPRWKPVGEFKTEKKAIDYVQKRAEFKPHTSYYDKHGNMHIEQTDW